MFVALYIPLLVLPPLCVQAPWDTLTDLDLKILIWLVQFLCPSLMHIQMTHVADHSLGHKYHLLAR